VVNNFASAADPAVCNAFFQAFYMPILQDTFFVLTDADHKSGFKMQSVLLVRLVQLVETNAITVPLFNPAGITDPSMTNPIYIRQYTANLLQNAFPHVSPYVHSRVLYETSTSLVITGRKYSSSC
jgi:exportin-1